MAKKKLVIKAIPLHEYCEMFPLMPDRELLEMIDDMKKNGFDKSHPIVIYKGKVLEGQNRQAAAILAEVQPVTTTFKGNDAKALDLVVRENLLRRQLTTVQRAEIALKIIGLNGARPGGKRDKGSRDPMSIAAVAKQTHVSEKSVDRLKAVKDKGVKPLQDAVRDEKIGLEEAAEIASMPKKEQQEAVKEAVAPPPPPKPKPAPAPKDEVKTYDAVYMESEFNAKDVSVFMNHRPKRGKLGFLRFHPSDVGMALEFISAWHAEVAAIVMIERSKGKADGMTKGDYDCCFIVCSDEVNLPMKDRFSNVMKEGEFIKKVRANEGKANLLLGAAKIEGWSAL